MVETALNDEDVPCCDRRKEAGGNRRRYTLPGLDTGRPAEATRSTPSRCLNPSRSSAQSPLPRPQKSSTISVSRGQCLAPKRFQTGDKFLNFLFGRFRNAGRRLPRDQELANLVRGDLFRSLVFLSAMWASSKNSRKNYRRFPQFCSQFKTCAKVLFEARSRSELPEAVFTGRRAGEMSTLARYDGAAYAYSSSLGRIAAAAN